MKKYYKTIEEQVQERFLRYVKIWTTSDRRIAEEKTPSTAIQFDLLNLLEKEMKDMGISDISYNEMGYLIGRIPANAKADTIGFMAHVDTASDAPGKDVKPQVHQNYDGKLIKLNDTLQIDPEDDEDLKLYVGNTVITTDGSTLLGADDKAGIAEIMTAASIILSHDEIKHGEIELIFTPDEETGCGMNNFPREELHSRACYTMDGGREGELEDECYYAYGADVTFQGIVIHPGYARGKLVNAVTMASAFVSMLPRNESPEATDGRFGNYWAQSISGSLEKARLHLLMRSFDADDIQRRVKALDAFAAAVEAAFPGGKVTVETKKQYVNMKEKLDENPRVMANVERAFELADVEPHKVVIRGGTDGSRLTEMGVPTPNIFTGGHNFHSRKEWIGVPAMVKAVSVILHLVETWTE
ncbi:peptidase T [Spirochaeta isovalerica]|uniref:Peptidase T n=1 Tax=Spirochaeta isovalerica TaxID=150 RepID=A0A841RJE7_9SPIO|nr:peptidase T [Spirochaeta isovalerica]MBB6482628.1 tripeptide aminopeptidase [Spirochaeta isovalerica]